MKKFRTERDNPVLPAGQLWVEPLDGPEQGTGWRYVGDTPGTTLNVASTVIDYYTSDGAIAELAESVTTQVTRSGNFVTRNISPENLALFVVGAVEEHTQAADASASQEIVATPGRAVFLGEGTEAPTGVRNITLTAVTNEDETTTYTRDEDYEIDEALGMLFILEGGAITKGSTIVVTYTVPAAAWKRVRSQDRGAQRYRLKVLSDNTRGAASDFYCPLVELAPSGDLQLKGREDWQQLALDIRVLKAPGHAAIYIDGRPVADPG